LGIIEIIIVLVVALVVLGPEKLPEVLVGVGRLMRELRSASNAVMREISAELDARPPASHSALMRAQPPEHVLPNASQPSGSGESGPATPST
jgi:Tat protein translocase TatB subunit